MPTTSRPLTLMAVHAHPDDEASSTGGILARYSAEGIRTVLVTCTNGELGNTAAGAAPGEAGHDEDEVVAHRHKELEASCEELGVAHLELLGYHDSGMMGWPQNNAPEAFWNVSVPEAAGRLAGLIDKYEPDIVVTYDENGFYGHPDHIQANRVTLAAWEMCGVPQKLYYPVIPKSALAGFRETLASAGVEAPPDADDFADMGTDDELVGAVIDCSAYMESKFKAIGAHASQTDNSFFLDLGFEAFSQVFNREAYLRKYDKTGASGVEDDLFEGLR
ncbi:MAG: PIG-L family deacetylase [Acidimicrobiales bacterium]